MKSIFFAAGLSVVLLSVQKTEAALTEIGFRGEVTGVHNSLDALWNPETVLGQEVTGRFLLDAAKAGNGREETDYFWWWDISGGEVMRSEVAFAGHHYRLKNRNSYDKHTGSGWTTSEFITLENGPAVVDSEGNEEGILVPDRLALKDTSSHWAADETDEENQQPGLKQIVDIRFEDHVNDFLEPPPLDQSFVWRDLDPDDMKQKGRGSFVHQQGESERDGEQQQYQYKDIFENELIFRLTEVVAKPARVIEPGSSGLLLLGLIGLHWLRKRQA